jgi:response regulator RpfG family c-di-GMP phosphodiesterase
MEKLLLVDDDNALRRMIKTRLSPAYEVIDTGDPIQALELALGHRPRVILLDLMMPDCSGFELCQSFHSLSYTARIPIFVVSGQSAAKYRDYMASLGAAAFFEKPIDFAKLKERLAQELGTRPLERRSHVRVRMHLTLKLKGTDQAQHPFEQLAITENVSAGGFMCTMPLSSLPEDSFRVFLSLSGQDRYVGTVKLVRAEAPGTVLRKYAFQFLDRTPEWILPE